MATTPNQPPEKESSHFILWLGIVWLLITSILGIYALVTKQSILSSVISFILTVLAIIIGVMQVAPNILSKVQRTKKTGFLVLGILLLVASFALNSYFL